VKKKLGAGGASGNSGAKLNFNGASPSNYN